MLREATLDDIAGAVRLGAVVNPEMINSVEGFRHNWVTSPPAARRASWAIEHEHEIVGWASAAVVVDTSEPGVGWMGVGVHPEHRRRGIGATLLESVERHARDAGIQRLLAWSRGDDGSAAFARSHGYEQTASNEILVVDPRTLEPPVLPNGVEVRPFAAFADDPQPVYLVDSTSLLDEPGEVRFDALSYDHWLDRFWRHPALDHDASMVVLVDGVAAATTWLQTDRATGRGQNNGTGTLPEHRGRGLATLAKRASLARVAELGCTAVYTGNDATNAPMLAINRKLGYRLFTLELSWRKALVPTSEL